MIHPLVKIITVDGYYTEEQARNISNITYTLQYVQKEFGKEIENFNMVPEDADTMFARMLNTGIRVDPDRSGVFRIPDNLIHFESFAGTDEWLFAVALQTSTFNVYEHTTGVANALTDYRFNYRNMFEWDLQVNYVLKPGQGVLFRPWLFHSFDTGQIQIFRLTEYEN
jgi:hypothetical protein